MDDAFGAFEGLDTEPGFDDVILADVVDGDFVVLFDLDKKLTELGIVKGFDGVLDAIVVGRGSKRIRIDGVEEAVAQLFN